MSIFLVGLTQCCGRRGHEDMQILLPFECNRISECNKLRIDTSYCGRPPYM